ncbi:MAG TPA: hypothetical protein VJY41_04485 [Prolixibacteraceae bacterium]|nr:hypothetical protein [Prolixibacteraceae bacterium]
MKYFLIIISTMLAMAFSNELKAGPQTQLHLQTDKQIYVSGENIAFKCVKVKPTESEISILYIDICGEGYTINQVIFAHQNNHWNGEITIPDSVESGIYLLRAYTGNQQGEVKLTTKLLTILNRFGNNQCNQNRKEKFNYQALNQMGLVISNESNQLKISASKHIFKPNDRVSLQIENKTNNLPEGAILSVFKIDTSSIHQKEGSITNAYTQNSNIKIFNKLTLCGTIIETNSKQAVDNETVLFSIPDSVPNLNYAYTNEHGEFRFQFSNYLSDQDAIIQTLTKNKAYTIWLNPIFLLPPSEIPYYISPDVENNDFSKLAISRATMHKIYGAQQASKVEKVIEKYPFYGYTQRRIYPEIYVNLNDFAEIAWEILPILKYRVAKDTTYLRIWDQTQKIYFNNPMMLIDGVPIFNPAEINVLHSELIQWIEIQPQSRCYGDVSIDGLVSIKTRKGNFRNIGLPLNAIRVSIETISENTTKPSSSKPMFSDVLFWDPSIEIGNAAKIEFECSMETGSYVALLQSFDLEGQLHQTTFQFEIEN